MNERYETKERSTRIHSDKYYGLGAYISKLERLQKDGDKYKK